MEEVKYMTVSFQLSESGPRLTEGQYERAFLQVMINLLPREAYIFWILPSQHHSVFVVSLVWVERPLFSIPTDSTLRALASILRINRNQMASQNEIPGRSPRSQNVFEF